MIRMTGKRVYALRHAAGLERDRGVGYSVYKALERAGLISWHGWHRGLPSRDKITLGDSRGWYLTNEGEAVVRELALKESKLNWTLDCGMDHDPWRHLE